MSQISANISDSTSARGIATASAEGERLARENLEAMVGLKGDCHTRHTHNSIFRKASLQKRVQ
jgi:hypothetical protein